MSSPIPLRSLLILLLLSLVACTPDGGMGGLFKPKPSPPPSIETLPPSVEDIAAMQLVQKRERVNPIIQQLRQNEHLSVTEYPDASILVQIRSGHVFSSDGVEVNPPMRPVLNDIARTLVAHPGLNVRAIGHTDNLGERQLNMGLSMRRAQRVREALVALGVDEQRISSEGRGDTEPLVPNTSAEGRAVNRRVDLLIWEF